MDYSGLHDAEINMKVCAALGLVLSSYARIIRQGDASILLDDNKTLVDYCNNPADAWPIIFSNRIGIVPGTATDKWAAHHGDWNIATADANPLRAAMTVFLLMQESANVQDNPA